ncbi:MAG: GIY-YIG nuclease family protein [Mycoplasmataceae bacterium]|nr:GIY-YIG nuclease family protein [Mycoplasmataceae bacterium]
MIKIIGNIEERFMKHERIYCIYKITNIKNNKIYVGQTNNLWRRINDHTGAMDWFNKNGGKCTSPLYKAAKKYGLNCWKIEIIEECSKNLLCEREKFWIKELDSVAWHGKGYNMTMGGEFGDWTLYNKTLSYEKRCEKARRAAETFKRNHNGMNCWEWGRFKKQQVGLKDNKGDLINITKKPDKGDLINITKKPDKSNLIRNAKKGYQTFLKNHNGKGFGNIKPLSDEKKLQAKLKKQETWAKKDLKSKEEHAKKISDTLRNKTIEEWSLRLKKYRTTIAKMSDEEKYNKWQKSSEGFKKTHNGMSFGELMKNKSKKELCEKGRKAAETFKKNHNGMSWGQFVKFKKQQQKGLKTDSPECQRIYMTK